jgi:hypothetical protein
MADKTLTCRIAGAEFVFTKVSRLLRRKGGTNGLFVALIAVAQEAAA